MIALIELDRINDWLWCLRTPIVQAYAVRERDGINLIDTSTAGQDGAILELVATVHRQPGPVPIHEILLTHSRRRRSAAIVRWRLLCCSTGRDRCSKR